MGFPLNTIQWNLPPDLESRFRDVLERWRGISGTRRLWEGDASLWSNSDEAKWLGWRDIVKDRLEHVEELTGAAESIRKDGIQHVLLLGMGGSSLCPQVLQKTFGPTAGYPRFRVLDSTDPAQVRTTARELDLRHTLFIVSSKSGSTLEPNIFKDYFFDRVGQTVGTEAAGHHFVAITDPGSSLHRAAEEDKFRHVAFGVPSIGGRYSALSNFGMLPAAIMGMDVARFLERTQTMVQACSMDSDPEENPGVALGLLLGAMARQGRDKVTLIQSPGLAHLGAWLEQLLAESTGKQGKGLIPVDLEAITSPDAYGSDRVFVYSRLATADAGQESAIQDLIRSGQPVVTLSLPDPGGLGQEFFRWEVATAVAGSVLGINPFDQPDVEASKVATRQLTSEYEAKGTLPAESPIREESGIALYADEHNARALSEAAGAESSLAGYLRAHLARITDGDYFALLAYLEMNPTHVETLQEARHAVRDRKRVATCLGFGPRFLHSTGQAYKGGPNSGVFLQVTGDDASDLEVPGRRLSFGVVKAAQARGDFQVLAERERRAIRIHLGPDSRAGLSRLRHWIEQSLA